MTKNIKIRTLSIADLVQSNLPQAFWNFQIDTYSGSQKALADLLHYIKRFDDARKHNLGLLIRGAAESQKTFLASYLVRALIMEGVAVRYASMPDLVDQVLRNEIILREYLRDVPLFVLDNVNVPGSTFWPTLLSRILTQRKDDGMPTVIVTQLMEKGNHDLFNDHYGETNLRLISHLSHTLWAERDDTKKHRDEVTRKALFVEET